MNTPRLAFMCSLLVAMVHTVISNDAMYVWLEGWDADVEGCGEDEFLAWENNACFTHSWNTVDKRQWLFDTCNREDREITTIYIYGMHTAFASTNCESEEVVYIKEMIADGKTQVSGLQVYGLLSSGGAEVPEQNLVQHFVWYNENCVSDVGEKIDGVALSNEDYPRTGTEAEQTAYLDNLQKVVDEANKQTPAVGSLKTHYSVGWVWGRDDSSNDINITWNGESKYVMHHFIDVFDSLDTQVAFITADEMQNRLEISGYSYSVSSNKEMLVNVYLNKDVPCQVTFFPFPESDTDCSAWTHTYKTEEAMLAQVDALKTNVPGIRVAYHYFRGPYSSGGYPGWPKHVIVRNDTTTQASSSIELTQTTDDLSTDPSEPSVSTTVNTEETTSSACAGKGNGTNMMKLAALILGLYILN